MKCNPHESAFPLFAVDQPNASSDPGLTKRELAALAAMIAFAPSPECPSEPKDAARFFLGYADALIAALNEEGGDACCEPDEDGG